MPDTKTLSFPDACKLLGISRQQGARLLQADEFPVPVLQLGRVRKVPKAPLYRLLGIEED